MNKYQIVGLIGTFVIAVFISKTFGRDYFVGSMFVFLGILIALLMVLFVSFLDITFSFLSLEQDCTWIEIVNLSKGKSCGAVSMIASYGLALGGFLCIFFRWLIRKPKNAK